METPSSPTKAISLSNQSAASAAARSNFWATPLTATNPFATNGPLKLTLSAYCRPENTVRLTDASPTQLIHTKYELLDPSRCRTLGHGASSTVRLAYRRSDGMPVAVKTIAKHDALGLWSKTNRWHSEARSSMVSPRDDVGQIRQQVKRTPRLEEVDVLTSLRDICPSIVQLLDVYETHQEVQLVLEYCEGGDLFDCIKRRKQLEHDPAPIIHGSFTEFETATVATRLLNVLDVLHSRNIVHRDIKPENILLVDEDDGMDQLGTVKLTDFGLARLLHDDNETSSKEDMSVKQRSRAYSRVGSDYYAAPEVHMGLGYDTPVDIYSLGITLYVMLCGTPPSSTSFFKSDDMDLYDEDASCVTTVSEDSSQSSQSSISDLFPSELKVSPLAQDLISKMIHPDPEKRIIASEALKHGWIIKHSVQEETEKIIHVTSKLSLCSSSDNIVRPRTLSFAETESFLRIGPALAVIPPSNSPIIQLTKAGHIGHTPEVCMTPTSPNPGAATISLTLADVCSKLAPLVDEQLLQMQRKHRHRSHSHADKLCFLSSRKHSRSGGGGEKQSKKKRGATTKRVYLEIHHPDLTLNSTSCANNRIGRRFNPSIPVLQQHSRSSA
mmetsp:Transcript_28541/g.60839  ORF Transcript_28541/g.60839 Transcript_28541/m.60839 type:complete len:610 (-) Transcript_28541:201-2030(-)